MTSGSQYGAVNISAHLHDAIVEMSTKQMEIVCIEDESHHLRGIITDGDLRRALGRKADIYSMAARDIMTEHPYTILDTAMAVDALLLMKEKNVSCLPVLTGEGTVAGVTTMTAIINAGLVA
jgi:arabinose-5-phosphate isomerase